MSTFQDVASRAEGRVSGAGERTGRKPRAVVSMTRTFIPEPGTLLLGSGIAGLAIIGRKRMRR